MKQQSDSSTDTGLRILRGAEPESPDVEGADRPRDRHLVSRFRAWLGAKRYRKGLVATGAAVLCAAVGILYMSTASSAANRYRFANAVQTDVTQAMTLSGTLSPTSAANVVFPTAGTVALVNVREGQTVKAGQALAQLDTTQLSAQVTQAESSLAQANLNLYNLENGVSTGGGGDFAAQSSSSTTSAVITQTGSTSGSTARLQQQVRKLQAELDQALAESKRNIAQAQAACRRTPNPSPSPSTSASKSASATASASASSVSFTSGQQATTASSGDECALAQQRVEQGQARIQQLQSQLSAAISALSRASQQPQTPSGGGGGGSNAGGETSGGSSASEGDIDAAEASVVAAEASLAAAEQNLAAATITSPIAGTVLSVPFTKGGQATTTDAIVVSGSQQFQVSLTVDVSKISQVKVRQPANIVPSGSTQSIPGTVSAIGVAPTTSDSSTTYPVTVTLTGTHNNLRSGSSASVEVVTAKAVNVTAVPTSALRTNANGSAVQVLRDGTQTRQPVTVGAIGATYTEIIDGLENGDQVILADLEEPMPTSGTTIRIPGGGSGGSFSGGMRGAVPGM